MFSNSKDKYESHDRCRMTVHHASEHKH